MNRERSAAVNEALVRIIIAKNDGEDVVPWPEIARQLGLSHDAVKQRAHRLRLGLKELVQLAEPSSSGDTATAA